MGARICRWMKFFQHTKYFTIINYLYITKLTELQISMKNLSDHTDLLCELLTSLLIRGIHLAEISKLGWLIGFVKHAI
jgi:hypothetical protein